MVMVMLMMVMMIMMAYVLKMIMRFVYDNNECECKWFPQVADALDALGPHRVGNPQVAWIEVETFETLLRCFEGGFYFLETIQGSSEL